MSSELLLEIEKLRTQLAETEERDHEALLEQQEVTTILESITDAFLMFDRQWKIIRMNKKAEQLLLTNRDALIGKVYWDVFPEAVDTIGYRELHRAVADQVAVSYEQFYPPLDTWFEARGFPFKDGVSVFFIDITKRKQMEDALLKSHNELEIRVHERTAELAKANEALQAEIKEHKHAEQEIQNLQRYNRGLIEASLDPLVTFNQKGIIMDVNEAEIQVTGSSREELIGTPFANYFTDPEKAYTGVMLVFETGEVRDYELIMVAKDGTETIVSYNASVYKDETGQVVGAFGVAHDITERKKAQQELEETIERLEVYTTRINSLMVTILGQITDKKTNVVVLDISGVAADVEIAEPLVNIARLSRLLGATCIVTGIKSETVRKLTDLGVSLAPITTERSLKEGLRYTIAIAEENDDNGGKKTT